MLSPITLALVALGMLADAIPAPAPQSMSTPIVKLPPAELGIVPRLVGRIAVPDVAFIKIEAQPNNEFDLLLSRFLATGSDSVSMITNVGAAMSNFNNTAFTTVPGWINWPNEVDKVSGAAFGGKEGLISAGGFLVPWKSFGSIYFSPTEGRGKQGDWINLYTDLGRYFYHRAIVVDVDADGQPDILTCRAQVPLFGGKPTGDLVYLTPKDRKKPTSSWPFGGWDAKVIGPRCDTFFLWTDLNKDGIPEIISSEYWGKHLTLITTTDPKGSFADASKLRYTSIDANVGNGFDLELVDVNGDGKTDLLVTNHQNATEVPTGAIYAYEIPTDIVNGSWKKHVLLENIPVNRPGQNQASPGAAHAFHPRTSDAGKSKPWIVASGDGSQMVHVIAPKSQDPNDWTYSEFILHDCNNTVGAVAVKDVDRDGWADVFVPCYNSGEVFAFSFKDL
ncbi:hypothetical protein HDU96_008119 [Phlyctochytrium bullatum]|nr:hypothetical protein HDU96_008119 [Phlyctochytrium bullatum]